MGSAFAIPDGHVCVIIADVKGFFFSSMQLKET